MVPVAIKVAFPYVAVNMEIVVLVEITLVEVVAQMALLKVGVIQTVAK